MLAEIVSFCDELLRIREIADYANAVNGLQLANEGRVSRIAAAVDACGYTIDAAAAAGCDLLVVHHGLFWQGLEPMTGVPYRRLRRALEAGLAVYSAHLPLDAHPRIGNSALLCAALELTPARPFFDMKGTAIGLRVPCELERDALVARLQRAVAGPVRLIPGGPAITREIGVLTGGAGSEVVQMAALGIDTLITGEGPHWTYAMAEDFGINILYGGHYATETFGVKALAAEIGARFALPWQFIDHPSGL
jgi:dinuclear metal center YbgI/SA1388 family protein